MFVLSLLLWGPSAALWRAALCDNPCDATKELHIPQSHALFCRLINFLFVFFLSLPESQIRRNVKGHEAEMRWRNKNGEILLNNY